MIVIDRRACKYLGIINWYWWCDKLINRHLCPTYSTQLSSTLSQAECDNYLSYKSGDMSE